MRRIYYLLASISVLIIILVFFFPKDAENTAYNFVLHFAEAEKKNFDEASDIDSLLPVNNLLFPFPLLHKQLSLSFSNERTVIIGRNSNTERFRAIPENAGYRFVIKQKKFTNTYSIFFKEKDRSNRWSADFIFRNDLCEIVINKIKNGKAEEIDRFEYPVKYSSKQVFIMAFFSDYLVILDREKILFQMQDPSLNGSGATYMTVNDGGKTVSENLVIYSNIPKKMKDHLVEYYNSLFPKKRYHKINYKDKSWNKINNQQKLAVNGKTSNYLRRLKIGMEVRPTILFKGNSSLTFTTKIPQNGKLEFCLSLVPKNLRDFEKLRFIVSIGQVGKEDKKEYSYGFKVEDTEPLKFIPYSLDLKDFEGKNCRIEFKFSAPKTKGLNKNKEILLSLSSPAIYPERNDNDYNVILISLDTLGASHLGCYGYERKTSKNIDSLASKGVVFKNATVCSSWTLPSHISMFTANYPFESGLMKNEEFSLKHIGQAFGATFIADERKTMAGYLQEAGYKTIGVHGGGFVSDFYGFDKGFSLYNTIGGRADYSMGKVINYLNSNINHKLFIFYHTYEIHGPYKSDYFVSALPPERRTIRDRTIARYDSGVRYADMQIGKLIAWLKDNNLFDKTIIIVTSDHGENFDNIRTKAGEGSHGNTLYDSEVQVPLVFGGAAAMSGGKTINAQVSSVDILPTVLDLLDIPLSGDVRGVSLLPLIEGKQLKSRLAYSEAIHRKEEKKSVRTVDNKLIVNLEKNRMNIASEKKFEMYDLNRDKDERRNIYFSQPKMAKSLRQYLEQIVKSINENRKKLKKMDGKSQESDADIMKELKGLGYLGD